MRQMTEQDLIEKVLRDFDFSRAYVADLDEEALARLLIEVAIEGAKEEPGEVSSATMLGLYADAVKTDKALEVALYFTTDRVVVTLTDEGVLI
jgi:hypothetical protein